jgi:hypothetical protein
VAKAGLQRNAAVEMVVVVNQHDPLGFVHRQ